MKDLIITFILLSQALFVFSQISEDCEGMDSIVLSGEFSNYSLEDDCITSIKITTLDEDTYITGLFLISGESVNIIPTNEYKINIKPSDNLDIESIKPRSGSGNVVARKLTAINVYEDTNDKLIFNHKKEVVIDIYPNPVQGELTIKINEIILNYKIIDFYGRTSLQGNFLKNKTVLVTELPKGLYFINIQTENKIVTKSFIKN